MPRNKNRIYLAFYSRPQHDDYHMAILVFPKRSSNPNLRNTWRLHVMNKPNPSRPTSQEWKYEPLEVIGRTGRLLALGLLGKTEKSGKVISEMLRAVELVQDDMSWNCKSWAFSAIEHLSAQGIIKAMPMSLDSLYDAGSQMARDFAALSSEERRNARVPTFNWIGEVIPSEIK